MKNGVLSFVSVLTGAVLGAGVMGKIKGKSVKKAEKRSGKHLALFLMMNQWVKIKQENKDLSSYFEKKGFKKIAIYGMSYVGETLVDELKNSNITVLYGIDQKADSIYADVDIVFIEDELQEVDAIVVTAITFFDEIEEKLSRKVDCPIISLDDILYEV